MPFVTTVEGGWARILARMRRSPGSLWPVADTVDAAESHPAAALVEVLTRGATLRITCPTRTVVAPAARNSSIAFLIFRDRRTGSSVTHDTNWIEAELAAGAGVAIAALARGAGAHLGFGAVMDGRVAARRTARDRAAGAARPVVVALSGRTAPTWGQTARLGTGETLALQFGITEIDVRATTRVATRNIFFIATTAVSTPFLGTAIAETGKSIPRAADPGVVALRLGAASVFPSPAGDLAVAAANAFAHVALLRRTTHPIAADLAGTANDYLALVGIADH